MASLTKNLRQTLGRLTHRKQAPAPANGGNLPVAQPLNAPPAAISRRDPHEDWRRAVGDDRGPMTRR